MKLKQKEAKKPYIQIFFSLIRLSDGVQFKMTLCALGKAHMRSSPSLRTVPNVVFETVPQLFWASETQAACDGCFFPASLSALSFPLTLACLTVQYNHRIFRRWMSNIDTCQSGLPQTEVRNCDKQLETFAKENGRPLRFPFRNHCHERR